GGSRLLSLPRGTEMFQFPRLPPSMNWVTPHHGSGVAPFGNPRINACSRLPGAYRRAPRPSSARCPKASTDCPYSLDHRNSFLHEVAHASPATLSRSTSERETDPRPHAGNQAPLYDQFRLPFILHLQFSRCR